MAIFGPKPLVNPFGKMSIFRLFELLFFYSLERRFFALEYRKRHFPGLYWTIFFVILCRVKRSFKPNQNEHNSVKDTGERSQKQRDIDLKISMKILFHCPPTFPFT